MQSPSGNPAVPPIARLDVAWTASDPARVGDFGSLVLPAGLPGFPDVHAFRLTPLGNAPSEFLLLAAQSGEGPDFVVLPIGDPEALFPDDELRAACSALEIDTQDLLVLLIVTLTPCPNGIEAHVNLRAPLVIDVRRRLGRQLVLTDQKLPLRQRLADRTKG